MYKQKTWKEKLESDKGLPKIVKVEGKMTKTWGDKLLIAAPMEVYKEMEKIPKGKLTTLGKIRQRLAKRHGATACCPTSSGIFAWIAANAAEEMGKSLPYWRTLKGEGEINEKYPGGIEKQKKLLEKEGFRVIKKGKKWVVEDWEKFLF